MGIDGVRTSMLFFDTEFTGLKKDTNLISLGIVAENGQKFYAEFTDYDERQCDEWIKENVIRNLFLEQFYGDKEQEWARIDGDTKFVHGTKDFVGVQLRERLSQFDRIQFVSDVCHYDFVLLIDLFGTAFDLPASVNPACHDINQDIARHYNVSEAEAFDKSREEIVAELCGRPISGEKHNSLYDAEVIKAIYKELF